MDGEILFYVKGGRAGGFVAAAVNHDIVTQAESVEELGANVRDAVSCHFDAADKPALIRLRLVRDEVVLG